MIQFRSLTQVKPCPPRLWRLGFHPGVFFSSVGLNCDYASVIFKKFSFVNAIILFLNKRFLGERPSYKIVTSCTKNTTIKDIKTTRYTKIIDLLYYWSPYNERLFWIPGITMSVLLNGNLSSQFVAINKQVSLER